MLTETAVYFEADSYFDTCSVCGTPQRFVRSKLAIRETYACQNCKGMLRERAQASAITRRFAVDEACTLAQLVETSSFRRMQIYEPGTTGAFRRLFRGLPNYHQSDYYPEQDRAAAPSDIPHQDLESTDYPDGAFDLIVSSDILEHVRRPQRAFCESARILKAGGWHIFTVPLQHPLRASSVVRVDTSGDEDVPLMPLHYHGNGKGGRSLVYTDFGADIVEMLSKAGFRATLEQPSLPSGIASRVLTVVAERS